MDFKLKKKNLNLNIFLFFATFQAVPPRGEFPNPVRDKLEKVNATLAEKLPSYPNAQFLFTDPSLFVSAADGSISHHDMHDYLHFTRQGYQKWVEPVLEEIQTLLKNFLTADTVSAGDPDLGWSPHDAVLTATIVKIWIIGSNQLFSAIKD